MYAKPNLGIVAANFMLRLQFIDEELRPTLITSTTITTT
jgi:hypothetical protein